MNDYVSPLYTLVHKLLNLGMGDSPIYSDRLTRLSREAYEQALKLYNAPEGDTPEEEARLRLSILIVLNVISYDNSHKQQYIQHLLGRCWNVPNRFPVSLLKVHLLTCCYSEAYEEELTKEVHSIIGAWDISSLISEQTEIIDKLRNLEENQYPFEVID